MIKNELNVPVTVPENQNMGLVYFKDPMPNNVMSMNNFVNIMNGDKMEEEDRLDVNTVKAFNDKIQSFGNNNMSNENDPYESEIQDLLNTHPETFYHENASNEFTEHLTYLPDPLDKVEHWTFEDVDIKHLDIQDQKKVLNVIKDYDVFACSKFDVGCTSYVKASLDIDRKSKFFQNQKQRFLDTNKLKLPRRHVTSC